MFIRLALVFLAATAIPGRSVAAGATLDSLLARAMRENPRIQAAAAAAGAATERVAPAGALPDPMLMFEAQEVPLSTPSPTNATIGRVTLTQMIPFPGKQGLMRSAMSEEAAMARAELTRARIEVAAEVHVAYYDLDRLQRSIDLLERTRTTMQMFADIARTKYVNGKAEQIDMLKANIELARESTKLATMQTEFPAATARLNALLGRTTDTVLVEPAPSDTSLSLPDLVRLEERAVAVHPMLRMKDSGVRRSELELQIARKEGLPDFTLGVEYMSMKDMEDAWTAMAGLTLPVWRGRKVAPNRRGAEQALTAARAERCQAENEVRAMVREAYAMAASARGAVRLYRDAVVPQAEASLASSKAGYETDRAGFLDLLEAQRTLLDSMMEHLQAEANFWKGRAALALVVGDPEMLGVRDE